MADCGFYGKIPSEGDFVSRRLAWEFTSAWDEWLQQGMLASRETLGARWLELYLSAPVWRFQLAPGVCGPLAWRGVFFASVDRVGRYFPLTVAFSDAPSAAAPAPSLATLTADDEAWLAIEDAALAGLEPLLGVDAFDRLIEALTAPAAPAAIADAKRPRVCLYTHGSAEMPATGFALDALPHPAAFIDLIAAPPAAPPPSSLIDLL
jgi:type VI secretion system protein ImpM